MIRTDQDVVRTPRVFWLRPMAIMTAPNERLLYESLTLDFFAIHE